MMPKTFSLRVRLDGWIKVSMDDRRAWQSITLAASMSSDDVVGSSPQGSSALFV